MDINIGAEIGRVALYLGVPSLIMVFFLQWRWSKTCERNIRVLVAQSGGGGVWKLAPKEGGEVEIYNPSTDTARTWPVNELATISLPYPGIGFLPTWMQKEIRVAIVNEGDWEPVLNRSPHRKRIASPDVVQFMQSAMEYLRDNYPANEDLQALQAQIDECLGEVSTGPTREMIADPAMLGNLMRSTVMRALASVSNDLMDTLKTINTKLGRMVGMSPTIQYVLFGLVIILVGFTLFQVVQAPDVSGMANDIEAIKGSLGIP